jgi:hypothetical protein
VGVRGRRSEVVLGEASDGVGDGGLIGLMRWSKVERG